MVTLVLSSATNSLLSTSHAPPVAPPLMYWHQWADLEGVSHWARCALTNWTWEEFLPPSSLWIEDLSFPSNLVLMTTPPGWVGPWHKNPVPQLVFVVAGTYLFTAMDGVNVTFTSGEIFFGNDQLSQKGHYTQNIGTVPGVLAAMQFSSWNVSETAGVPCWLH